MARTAYYGVVTFMVNTTRVYAIPANLDLTKPFGSMPASEIYERFRKREPGYEEQISD